MRILSIGHSFENLISLGYELSVHDLHLGRLSQLGMVKTVQMNFLIDEAFYLHLSLRLRLVYMHVVF